MTLGELKQLNEKLLKQIQDVFEELTQQVQEKDSLASELNVRHIAIEQLLKNCSKLPCLQMGRAGMKSNVPIWRETASSPPREAVPYSIGDH